MRTLRILLFAFLGLFATIVYAQDFEWVEQWEGSSDSHGESIAVDASGNVYTMIDFKGTVDFDPGAGYFTLTSAGSDAFCIIKLDAAGNFSYAKQISGTDVRVQSGSPPLPLILLAMFI